jgi:hypothetical protein
MSNYIRPKRALFSYSLLLIIGFLSSVNGQEIIGSQLIDPEVIYEGQVQPASVAPIGTSSICEDSANPLMCGTFEAQNATGLLNFDTPFTSRMLDFQNRQGDKEAMILNHGFQTAGQRSLTLGAQFRASGLFARTNTTDKFSYLGRFPTDFVGDKASDFRLLHANQNVTAHVNSMVHGYFETLFSDVFSFESFNQGSFQVRQAYVVFGDFSRSPWYGHVGKKNTSFGDMGTLSPFSQAMPWHYFGSLSEGAGVGFDNGRINATLPRSMEVVEFVSLIQKKREI